MTILTGMNLERLPPKEKGEAEVQTGTREEVAEGKPEEETKILLPQRPIRNLDPK